MKNRYFPTAVGLYFNYFVHGMGVILMSLNMSSLEQQWHTSAAGVSIVISSLGIGRLSVLLIAGMLSDRFHISGVCRRGELRAGYRRIPCINGVFSQSIGLGSYSG